VANFAANVFATNRMETQWNDIIFGQHSDIPMSAYFFSRGSVFFWFLLRCCWYQAQETSFCPEESCDVYSDSFGFHHPDPYGTARERNVFWPGHDIEKTDGWRGSFFLIPHWASFFGGAHFLGRKNFSLFVYSAVFDFRYSVLLGHLHYSIDVFSAFSLHMGSITSRGRFQKRYENCLKRPDLKVPMS